MATVLVTGATGLVGANLAHALLDAGHQVRATKRGSSKTEHLAHLDIEWVVADLQDAAALAGAARGVDAVFHCAAAVSIRKVATETMTAVNVGGTDNIIAACRAAGVARLIHCSSTVTVGLSTDGAPSTEDSPFNFAEFGLDDGYCLTKRAAEQRVLAGVEEGLDAVIVNPGFMFGPYDIRPSSGEMILSVVRRDAPGASTGFNCFVDVRDVVRGMILAWEKGGTGQRYILGGRNWSYPECWARIAQIAAVKPITRIIPRFLATPVGWLGDVQEAITGKEPLINSNTVNWGYCDRFQFSSDKAIRELGYSIRDPEDGIAACLDWFRETGRL